MNQNPDKTDAESAELTGLFNAQKKRTIVYIDAFNFYHGSIKGTPHKWLDIQRYFDLLRPAETVSRVRYFTAPMHGSSGDRQRVFLQALETLPKVDVILGRYKTKRVTCNVAACTHSGDRKYATWEEKRTDVSIGLSMLDDAYQGDCDVQVLVTGDSDLVPAVHAVKRRFPDIKIVVYVPTRNPTRGAAVEIRSAADKDRNLPQQLLSKSHLPTEVTDGIGGVIRKPSSW